MGKSGPVVLRLRVPYLNKRTRTITRRMSGKENCVHKIRSLKVLEANLMIMMMNSQLHPLSNLQDLDHKKESRQALLQLSFQICSYIRIKVKCKRRDKATHREESLKAKSSGKGE